MKILHIHPSLSSGGIESMICALANEMAKKEDVSVCSIFKPKSTDIFWYKLSTLVHRITIGKKKKGFSVKVLFQILLCIYKGHYDVVNMHGMFYYYMLPVFLLHKKIKFFYTVHSDAVKENTGWDKHLFFIKKYCIQRGYIHPITISNVSQASFASLYNCPSDLIFNGVPKPLLSEVDPIRYYRVSSQTKVFIHAGRIDVPKNQLVLCKVFYRLINEGYDVVLLIAGSKVNEDIFNTLEPYFSERIYYLGEREDIIQLMANSDAMCLPSIWEGLPVTLLEALSVGCIPICSNVGGIPDVVVSGINGFLSSSFSEEDYYVAVKEYLSLSQSEIEIVKNNCVNSFFKYDIVNTAEMYINLYNRKS